MMGSDVRERAERNGHHYELWSRRPLAGWAKTAANKLLSRRLERAALKREVAAFRRIMADQLRRGGCPEDLIDEAINKAVRDAG